MIEVTEVLRLLRDGLPTKRLAAQLGLDPKTSRRYLKVARCRLMAAMEFSGSGGGSGARARVQ
jgi:hypothetical protein